MTPMKRKTPYRTGMGIRAKMGVIRTLRKGINNKKYLLVISTNIGEGHVTLFTDSFYQKINVIMPSLKPVRIAIINDVSLCSLTPRNWGFSPGMDVELSLMRDWM